MIINAMPAQPQNNGDNPGSIVGCSNPINPNDIIATRTNPIISSIFAMFLSAHLFNQKDIWFCKPKNSVDKYLLVILIFMVVTIPIAFVEPSTGEIRDRPIIPLFYAAIAGIIIIIFTYSTYKERKERQAANAKRRSRK